MHINHSNTCNPFYSFQRKKRTNHTNDEMKNKSHKYINESAAHLEQGAAHCKNLTR